MICFNAVFDMSRVAKIFTTGRSQAVRLPVAFRFDTQEVFIRRDPDTGDVILSRRPADWSGFIETAKQAQVPDDFLSRAERMQLQPPRDPLDQST